jgi:membrane dipeptidase
MLELTLSKKKFFDLSKTEEERALDLHQKAIIIDAMTCINPRLMPPDRRWFTTMKNSGVTASSVTSTEQAGLSPARDFRSTVELIFKWYDLLEKSGESVVNRFATRTEDIQAAKKAKTHILMLNFQHPDPIEHDVHLLSVLHELGTRVMQLTYNEKNRIGDGCTERTDCGLSHFGLQVIQEMNRLGMLIDLSHCGHMTTMEAIEHSKDPVAFTHVGMRPLCDNVRNKTDEELMALAEKDGLVGIVSWSPLAQTKKGVRPTVEDYLSHVEYAVKLIGVDHVGIGLDLSYGEITTEEEWEQFRHKYPNVCGPFAAHNRESEGLETISGLINITRGLVAGGYSDQEINKILGDNFLRLFKRVWRS